MNTHPEPIEIQAETTPNPNTLKFNVNRILLPSGSLNYTDREKAKGSPLAERLFGIANVLGVMVGRDFVTVTKAPATEWRPLVEPITNALTALLESSEPLFPAGAATQAAQAAASGHGEIEARIRAILDNEIRPAVNMDGGDITFYGYEDGVVTLHLQGSCSHCPSSILTLKMGVENRLKALVPEIREVVQL